MGWGVLLAVLAGAGACWSWVLCLQRVMQIRCIDAISHPCSSTHATSHWGARHACEGRHQFAERCSVASVTPPQRSHRPPQWAQILVSISRGMFPQGRM